MKINTIKSNRLNKKGMTLIEISLVVALLLSLIAILFVGIAAYKKGADRSKCLLNISSIQKAARSHQNMYELNAGDALLNATLIGAGLYIEVVACPNAGEAYNYADVVTAVSVPFATCPNAAALDHAPKSTQGW